jgi:hypothetical protein
MTTPVFSEVWTDNTGVTYTMGVTAKEDEKRRKAEIATNRLYFDGAQYDVDNESLAAEMNLQEGQHLEEHERKHAAATQIRDCVEFISYQLTDGFQIIAKAKVSDSEQEEGGAPKVNDKLQEVIDQAVDATDLLSNFSDEDIAVDAIMIDGAQAGDVPYETHWDPVTGTAYWTFWPAEWVEFDVPRGQFIRRVVREQTIDVDVTKDGTTTRRTVKEKVVYELVDTGSGGNGEDDGETHTECRRTTFWDREDKPVDTQFLGVPFIPWGVIRVHKEGIRGFRGDPLVNRAARDATDRYNAVEQLAYKIARFNSHSNLAVSGDQAFVKIQQDKGVNKDLEDVLGFPGSTLITAVSLPTDTQMIEHVRAIMADAIYSCFGLVRVEPNTFQNLGAITGYALEILNRKSEGKLRRVRRIFKTDMIRMINQMLDVTAYKLPGVSEDDVEDLEGFEPFERDPDDDQPSPDVPNWWDIDPDQVFPDRDIEIRMGTGYIVDDVAIRDDYTAKLISRREGLRQRGHGEEEVDQIEAEISDEASQATENMIAVKEAAPDVAMAGENLDEAKDRKQNGNVRPSGTTAGAATGSTNRK